MHACGQEPQTRSSQKCGKCNAVMKVSDFSQRRDDNQGRHQSQSDSNVRLHLPRHFSLCDGPTSSGAENMDQSWKRNMKMVVSDGYQTAATNISPSCSGLDIVKELERWPVPTAEHQQAAERFHFDINRFGLMFPRINPMRPSHKAFPRPRYSTPQRFFDVSTTRGWGGVVEKVILE